MVNPGKKRVIINNILPSVEGGRYPAKAIINKPVHICASVFADGHEKISAVILLKHSAERQWKEVELLPQWNDEWTTLFIPGKLGTYQFQVAGWIDHFGTWLDAIRKKYAAGQDILIDLKAGVEIAREALPRITGSSKKIVSEWTDALAHITNIKQGYDLALDDTVHKLMLRYRNKQGVTIHPQTFEITVDREKALFSTWYELFPRSAANINEEHGTFNDVRRLLPRVSKMGFDVLYLPPIHPIGHTHRKGKNNSLIAKAGDPGSPWAIGNEDGGHKAIHRELGSLRDFRKLIEDAKHHGIEIAMDIAFQCSPDHPYVKEHPEWFKWRADGTVQYAENPPKKYEDILPFDFESSDLGGLWEELRGVIEYWAENGISIFRVDNPHTKAIPFWQWAIGELKAKYPNLIFLAEAFTRPRIMEQLAKIGFTQSYTYFTWRNSKKDLQEYVTELTSTDLKYYFRPNFWTNTPDILHDELVHGGENMHIIRLILAATMSSNYGIYGPVYEYNVNEPTPGKEEYYDNEKYEIRHWDWDKYTKTRELITRVNRIRREQAALQETNNIVFATTENDRIICYAKIDKAHNNILIVVVNMDPYTTQSGMVQLPPAIHKLLPDTFSVHDLLSDEQYVWNKWNNYVSLNPFNMPAHIFKVIK